MKRMALFLRAVGMLLVSGVLLGVVAPLQAQASVRIIWLHHSCGEGLIEQGSVREGLTALGYEFYDHGYNDEGLRLADGSYSGRNFDVPGDNTDPDGLAEIFSQPLHDPPDNTFSYLMQYDVIAFKSCYPVSNIGSDEQLAEYQSYYLTIRARVAQYPDKLFVVVTQPPQVPGSSDRDEANAPAPWPTGSSRANFWAGSPTSSPLTFSVTWPATTISCGASTAWTTRMPIPTSGPTARSGRFSLSSLTRRSGALRREGLPARRPAPCLLCRLHLPRVSKKRPPHPRRKAKRGVVSVRWPRCYPWGWRPLSRCVGGRTARRKGEHNARTRCELAYRRRPQTPVG